MKIIAFNGSPRPGGNTELLLEGALQPLREGGNNVIVFKLNSMNVKPCQDCGGCVKSGLCIHSDDMSNIYDAIREAERIILASPIFFYSLSAQAKAMIDRCQSFWCEKYRLKKSIPAGLRGRKGLLLLVGGMKKEDGRHTAEVVAKGFFRTISVPEHETLFFGGIDAIGDILTHPTALHEAHEAGLRLGR
ncbi:MAG TPA: flavodoxin family protein [Nitrospirota bacterium]|nr:flavodoxin family protein [Nitrospirota bacterium]